MHRPHARRAWPPRRQLLGNAEMSHWVHSHRNSSHFGAVTAEAGKYLSFNCVTPNVIDPPTKADIIMSKSWSLFRFKNPGASDRLTIWMTLARLKLINIVLKYQQNIKN